MSNLVSKKEFHFFESTYKKSLETLKSREGYAERSVEEVIQELKNAPKGELPAGTEFETKQVLLEALESQKKSESVEQFTDKMLAKFEVFGKVFSHYTKDFRKVGSDYLVYENYLLLGLILARNYKTTECYKTLNAFFKLADLTEKLLEAELNSPQLSLASKVLELATEFENK